MPPIALWLCFAALAQPKRFRQPQKRIRRAPSSEQRIQAGAGLCGEEAERLADKHIRTEHLLLGVLREENCFAAQILMERGLRLSQVREELGRQPHEAMQLLKRPSVLDELSPYLSDPVDQTQPLVGCENELDRLIELLCRLTGKNPVLVGVPGVGKRTIVGGLARRIADGNVPQSLAEKAILGLDLPPLRALEKDGSWHEKLDRALVTAAQDGKIFFLNRMRFYSQEERKERDNLKQLREKYKLDHNPALNISREEIEKAVSKLVGNSSDAGATNN
jgi:ATP-dependent Clp protease ATP-binding subunit ClpA